MSTLPQRFRVLIVEDEPVVAADLRASLEGLGYLVVGAADTGAGAMQAAAQTMPDVVLMDVGLKGSMDGIAAAGELRRQWSIPVVFVTANTNEETLLRASATGPYGYLLKPFRAKELNATILVAVRQHRLARELFSEQTWLRTMLSSLSDGVIATDTQQGCVRYMNPAGEALAGLSLEEAAGKPIEEIYTLTTLSNERVKMAPLTGPPLAKSRLLLHSRDGRVIPVEVAASPVESAGEVIGAVTVFTDITERLRRERELEVERDRLEEQVQLTTEALGNTRAELRALSGHLMNAQEDERRRVARELHDNLCQRAAIAQFELQRLIPLLPPEDKDALDVVGAVRQRIADLSADLRAVSHRLHPAVVEHLGLATALEALVDEYRERGAEASFLARGARANLPVDTATALYRIAQEGLQNASKHAPGAPVRVALEETEAELRLRIEDAGPGFDLNLVRGGAGLGLLSMQERARLAGGSLLLRTRLGEGTLVLVRVPLECHRPS